LGYAILLLARGDAARFGLIVTALAVYYAFLLHPAVVKEVRRRKALKKGPAK